jgi:hypothetical protein
VAVPLSLPVFGSAVAEVIVAVLVMTPVASGLALTTNVKTLLPTDMLAIVQVMVPVAPAAGVVHDQLPGGVSETKVVLAGTASLSESVAALLGPALLTVMV